MAFVRLFQANDGPTNFHSHDKTAPASFRLADGLVDRVAEEESITAARDGPRPA
jgi:hypothetical protein